LNEPRTFDLANWALELATAGFAAILAAILAAVTRNKQRKDQAMHERLAHVEQEVHEHETKLSVIQTCQINTAERLNEIRETTQNTNEKISAVQQGLMDVLVAIKTK
jgi:septal ring factor EnvC (AmiA/AmiB activator)